MLLFVRGATTGSDFLLICAITKQNEALNETTQWGSQRLWVNFLICQFVTSFLTHVQLFCLCLFSFCIHENTLCILAVKQASIHHDAPWWMEHHFAFCYSFSIVFPVGLQIKSTHWVAQLVKQAYHVQRLQSSMPLSRVWFPVFGHLLHVFLFYPTLFPVKLLFIEGHARQKSIITKHKSATTII